MKFTLKTIFVLLLVSTFSVNIAYSALSRQVKGKITDKILAKNQFIVQSVNDNDIVPRTLQVKFKKEVFFTNSYLNVTNILKNYIDIKNIQELSFPFKPKYENHLLSAEEKYGINRISTIYFNSDIDPTELSIKLMENDFVEYATPVFKRNFSTTQVNDPFFTQQYAMDLIKIADAWDITTGDTSIVIAIVDSGTDINHEDLNGNIFTNWKEIPNNGIDDDKNGKIDDVNGWDFVGNLTTTEYQSGVTKEDNNPIPNGSFHGTHVAGCASAVTNNSKGIASPGFKSKILPIKCSADNPNLSGILKGYEAILYAARTGADVINCSWGGPGASPSEQDIINTAVELGAVVVVAAGNDGSFIDLTPQYPANYDNVVNVGASGPNDAVAGFTNYGNSVTVYAPGSQILSTMPNNMYSRQDGTSFSSPIVSGIVALLKSIHPDWTPMQFIRHLRSTSDKSLTGVSGFEQYFVGRVNAFKAVTYNNPNASENKVPGILAETILVNNSKSSITDLGTSNLKIELKNYLADAENLIVKISAIDKYIAPKTTEITVQSIASLESEIINFDVELLDNCPLYEGTAQILLTYQSGEYIDYQVIDLPLTIPTENKFTSSIQIPTAYNVVPYGSSLPSKNVAWAVGNSPIVGTVMFSANNGASNINSLGADPAYCIYGFNDKKVILGVSPDNGIARVQISTNSGQNWNQVNVSNLTPFINAIHFYNDYQGILLGDPVSSTNTWGVAKTNDGGNTWSLIQNLPTPLVGETGYVESIAILGNKIWFGTSRGRVFYSNDKGETWNVSKTTLGSSLSKMSFMNDKVGYALYNIGSGTAQVTYMAYTTDGGNNWSLGVHDFSKSGIRPMDIHCVPEANKLILVGNINDTYESDDNGGTWKPILTKRLDGVTLAQGLNDGVAVRLWSFAMSGVGYLDFILGATSERKEISSVTDNPFNYGDIKVNSSKIGKIEFKNSGNVDLKISDVKIVFPDGADDTEFRISAPPKLDLKPAEVVAMNVIFRPKSAGAKTASLVITSDSDPAVFEIKLLGNGTDETSVIDFENKLLSISPNPASEVISINLHNSEFNSGNYKIIDKLGNTLYISEFNSSNFDINLGNLASGNYFIILEVNGDIIVKKFIKM